MEEGGHPDVEVGVLVEWGHVLVEMEEGCRDMEGWGASTGGSGAGHPKIEKDFQG